MGLLALGFASVAAAAENAAPAQGSPAPAPAPTTVAAPASPAQPAVPARIERVHVIPIQGEIGSSVLYVVRRGIKEAMAADADLIVFDMKTPGGALGPTLEIMEAIARFPRPTITYVNSEAMSAGAFIAASTQEIWFAPQGIIGAAAPVAAGGQDVEATMKLKVVSYLKARIRAESQDKGYRGEVISAMIDADREFKIGDKVIKEKGELLSLTAVEAARTYGTPPQPLLSAGTAGSLADLIAQRSGGTHPKVTTLEMTWSETLASWLNSIAPVLLGIGMLALFIEFKTPGFGVFGIVGIVLLAIVFLSSYIAGLSGHEPILFFVLGVALLAVEIFFFPGTVVMGVAGLLLIFGSLVWAMADLWPNEPLTVAWSGDAFVQPLLNLLFGLLIAGGVGVLLIRFLPRGWVWDRLVLNTAVAAQAQVSGGASATTTRPDELIGARGVAATALRPSGQIDIDGRRYEARVEMGTVPAGASVVVVRRTDFELIVEETHS
ncbi:hypothetical protein DB354_08150 [Opitutus sp. ER46]|nr:hypothetical protein DB354_08150 [Opitutus sp. ER46]